MDDDPFTSQHQPRRRRSSMFDKWINDQQARHASPQDIRSPPQQPPPPHPHPPRSSSNAYLAYPELNRTSLEQDRKPDLASEGDYDLVNDNDIPDSILSQLSNMQILDTPTTIRSTRRSSRPRVSLTPSSFRHFGLVFRAPSPAHVPSSTSSSHDTPSRPSSRVSLFSRSGTVTPRDSLSFLSRKPSKQPPQITVDSDETPLSPTTSPPPTLRTTSTLASESTLASPSVSISPSHWRPSILGHFSSLHSTPSTDPKSDLHAKDRETFTSLPSIHTPPDDTNDTPSRPSISSSIDTSLGRTPASTSLTVPGGEGIDGGSSSSSRPPSASPSISTSLGSPVPPKYASHPDADAARSKKKNAYRYSSPVTQATHLHPHSHSHSHSYSHSYSQSQSPHVTSLSGTSTTTSPRSQGHHPPVSLANNPHLADLFLPSRESSPSPTSTRCTTPSPNFHLSNNDADAGSASRSRPSPNHSSPLPKRYPFVYNNTVQVTARRGANAFNGFYPSYDYWSHDAPNHDGEEDDDVDLDSNMVGDSSASRSMNRMESVSMDLGRSVSGLSRSVSPASPASQYQRSIGHSSLQQQQKKKKPKPEVVYASNASGRTLRRMTSFSNLHLGLGLQGGLSKKKKKKLVIGGVPPDDARRFEGVKRWCESFGEVRQIKRMPNGDLVVSFQSAEVADTVCCLRAKVFINGVGSVHLSWTTGRKH